ncbi:hypothetical protein PPYR_00104 [Photinus pyralis]|uniref:Uncharacterized protein n=2 Tax=Photinus pyralis TaxID=7054 RepID=A0A1Y1KEV9_PHOPY|nr:uncharacterized protein LOC116158741 [Photinus pyralis]XP_031334239.1 uncharacterized protein LOC116164235 [Photinus pyralis]XP_031359031.1 uncharacterized protein LOC116182626 [Photinus pyralis]KAB0803134.1 hypothetical protein PPYR_00104 [Photinus pyralis]
MDSSVSEILNDDEQRYLYNNLIGGDTLLSDSLLENVPPASCSTEYGSNEPNHNKVILNLDEIQSSDTLDPEVDDLLRQWQLESLRPCFIENQIDLTALKHAQPHHINELLNSVPLGLRIKLEQNISKWKESHQNTAGAAQKVNLGIQREDYGHSTNEKEHTFGGLLDSVPEIINVEKILQNYAEGKTILKLIDGGVREIPMSQKQTVVDKIVDYFIQQNQKLNVSAAKTISIQINKLFPEETPEYYFAPQTGKAPKGKLLSKYYNQVRRLTDSGLLGKKVKLRSSIKHRNIEELPAAEENCVTIKEKLKYVQEGERWEQLVVMWKSVQNYRRKMLLENQESSIVSFLNEWPAFKRPLGYTLVDLDFEYLYSNAESLFTKWEIFSRKIFDYLMPIVKDKRCKCILQKFVLEQHSDDEKAIVILFLLHAALTPTSKKVTKTENKSTVQKFTIGDSQDSFIVFGKSVLEIESKLLSKKSMNQPVQPLIAVLHENEFYQAKQVIVLFDNVKYYFVNIVPALDCCFKVFHVFDFKYPQESLIVWQFIQIYFYNIQTAHDAVIPKLTMFLKELNKVVN